MFEDGYDGIYTDAEDDTFSVYTAFDMDEYNLRGLRIYMGRRRALSIDAWQPEGLNIASECRNEWADVNVDDSADVDKFNMEQRAVLGFERGFVDPNGPVAEQMGQAIDLALRMMETQKSINIMTAVAQRLVNDCPEVIHHITPESTWDQIQTSVRAWLAKLRQDEFFKIQVIDNGDENSGVVHRFWPRFTSGDSTELATLADYKPHYAGMLIINVKVV